MRHRSGQKGNETAPLLIETSHFLVEMARLPVDMATHSLVRSGSWAADPAAGEPRPWVADTATINIKRSNILPAGVAMIDCRQTTSVSTSSQWAVNNVNGTLNVLWTTGTTLSFNHI